ncbi:hypothetical protein DIZ27_15870 [Streptomyces sp. NWU339]|nr:hypothetical protein DIZ27_15870 [Streptomyces sp. NWU339]
MRRGLRRHRGGGRGVRLAHGPQSSIDRLRLRLRHFRPSGLRTSGNEKSPRTGGDAAPIPTTWFDRGRD